MASGQAQRTETNAAQRVPLQRRVEERRNLGASIQDVPSSGVFCVDDDSGPAIAGGVDAVVAHRAYNAPVQGWAIEYDRPVFGRSRAQRNTSDRERLQVGGDLGGATQRRMPGADSGTVHSNQRCAAQPATVGDAAALRIVERHVCGPPEARGAREVVLVQEELADIRVPAKGFVANCNTESEVVRAEPQRGCWCGRCQQCAGGSARKHQLTLHQLQHQHRHWQRHRPPPAMIILAVARRGV